MDHDEGRIVVDGIEVSRAAGALPAVRKRITMVFEQFNLLPHLTALECTVGPERTLGVGKAEARASAMALPERVRIPEQAHGYPAQLSGGRQQRAAIARAGDASARDAVR